MIEYRIKENQPPGLIIGKVFDNIKSNTNPIWFLATEDSLRFSLSKENDLFELDSKSGFLKSKKVIDLEELCPRNCINDSGIINLTINIWSRDALQGIAKVKIVVLDVNDNAPYFDPSAIQISLKEMVYTTGKTIDLPRAIDHDIATANNIIEYKLKINSSHFELQIKNQIQPYLVLTKTMDSEEVDVFDLYLLAWNKDLHESKTSELHIIINILDINDNEPSFSKTDYLVPVAETAVVGSIIYQLLASDPDKNSRLVYSAIPETPSAISSMLKIEPDGSIRLLRTLDYETQQFYQMSVRVTDGEFNAFTKIKIVVMDINDQAPQFSINPVNISVYENSEILEIARLNVIDRDSEDINGVITCFEPENLKKKQILAFHPHPNNNLIFTLKLVTALNREIFNGDIRYALLICHDNGIPTSLTATCTVTVHVMDRNDNRPVFTRYSTNITIRENSPITDLILKFTAKDLDKDENGRVIYDILSNTTDDTCCIIDPNLGLLYSKKPFDREMQSSYQIVISATDQAISESRFTTYITVTIIVLDENDEIPKLIEPLNLTIPENEPSQTYIGTLYAQDKDAGRNGEVKFSIIPSSKANYFYMSSNGSLFSKRKFDRELKARYCIPINVEDMGRPVTNAIKTTVCITILDRNDNAPTINLPNFDEVTHQSPQMNTDAFYQINVSLYSLIQYPFAKIEVEDLDAYENSNVTLTLVPNPSTNPRLSRIISLDHLSKQLFMLESPSLGDIGCYRYTLVAIDSGQPQLSSKKNLLICITTDSLNTRRREKDRDHTLTKANILIVITLAGTSAFLTALLVSAILCMIQPCKHFRRRTSHQSQNDADMSLNSPDEIRENSQQKSKDKGGKFFCENLLDSTTEIQLKQPDRGANDNSWGCQLSSDKENQYATLLMTRPHFIPGSEEQRSDSGRGASDEDNIIPPSSNICRLSQINTNLLMKPILSTQSCSSKNLIETKVLETCSCDSLQQPFYYSISNSLQSHLNLNALKILSSGAYIIDSDCGTITQATSQIPHCNKGYAVENSLYTDTNVGNPNIVYPMDSSLQNITDLSTHIDQLFFSHCCKKY